MLGFTVADRMAGNLSLTEFHKNPPKLIQGEKRYALYHPELFPHADLLRSVTYLGHHVRYFGVVHRFKTLDDHVFTCDQVIYWYWCEGDWHVDPA